ncbi:hypothetical protein GCM10023093_09970 [Nemorincola caseinilytica]|uniref:WG repeat-containing protein n=1 Tax=Nemorincola caseinilytica TaxID=2054315 RepID=A0ABP8N9K5_9BACT
MARWIRRTATGRWRKSEQELDPYWNPRESWSCGGSNRGSVHWITDELGIPDVYGSRYFVKDGQKFESIHIAERYHTHPNGGMARYFTVRARTPDSAMLYAIVDTGRNYIVAPGPGPMPLAIDREYGLMIARQNSLYGIIDTAWRTRLAFQPRQIAFPLPYNGRCYALIDTAIGNGFMIIDSAGREIKTFRNKEFDNSLLPKGVAAYGTPYTGRCVMVTDSNGNKAVMAPDGKLQYPAIAYKYKDLISLGNSHFMAGDMLLNGQGKELFSGLRFPAAPTPLTLHHSTVMIDAEELYYDASGANMLQRIEYRLPGTKATQYLLVSPRGHIYADALGQ